MSLQASFDPPPPPTPPGGHGLLVDKVVIVTAAAGTGIGSATARRCLEEGASVVLSDAHARRLAETAEQLVAETGGAVHAVPCDVTDEAQVQGLYAAAVARFGRFDVAVHNAGLGGTVPLVDMTDAQWSTVLDITLTGTFRCTRAALTRLVPQGRGVIVNNASVLGWRAQPGQAHYAAAKAGVMALTRCAAAEAAPAGVRVNAVSPSLAEHPFLNRAIPDEDLAVLRRRELFGRGAETWEVANVIVFLSLIHICPHCGVARLDESVGAGVAGEAHRHLVHDIADGQFVLGIGEAVGPSGPSVAERPLAPEEREGVGDPEAQADVLFHIEAQRTEDPVGPERPHGPGFVHLSPGQDRLRGAALDGAHEPGVKARERGGIRDAVGGGHLGGVPLPPVGPVGIGEGPAGVEGPGQQGRGEVRRQTAAGP